MIAVYCHPPSIFQFLDGKVGGGGLLGVTGFPRGANK